MNCKPLFFLAVSMLTISLAGCRKETNYQFPNALVKNLADPFVLVASDGAYYMYGTSTNSGGAFKVWQSYNLEDWIEAGTAFSNTRDHWAYRDFWAPEVIEYRDKFYMFYTAREKETERLQIGISVSDAPQGPFIDERKRPFLEVDYAVIDASVFIDEDDLIYLYYARDCSENVVDGVHRSDIYVVELDEYLEQKGQPIYLFSPTQAWETQGVQDGWLWNEGPSVIKLEDQYYMTYSGNPYYAFEYAIGVATSQSPTGPFEKYEGNPVVQGDRDQDVSGPGHNSIFRSHDGSKTYIAYHVHMNPIVGGGEREVLISEVRFGERKMKLVK